MTNISNLELSKRISQMQKACAAKKCYVYMLTESARLWLVAAEQKSDSWMRHLSQEVKQNPTQHSSCFLSTWIQLRAGPILVVVSPNIFFSYWSTQNFWLKSIILLLLCVSYTCHFGSHSIQQTLLVLPSVNTTLGRESVALRVITRMYM